MNKGLVIILLINVIALCHVNLIAKESSLLNESIVGLSLAELTNLKKNYQEELNSIAEYALNYSSSPVGFRGNHTNKRDVTEWIKISFEKETDIDEIHLVPTLIRGKYGVAKSDCFPKEFKILVGKKDGAEEDEVLHYTSYKNDFPRLAPLIFKVDIKEAQWLKIVPITLSKRNKDDQFVFQINEILLFKDKVNTAIGQTISTNAPLSQDSEHWNINYVIDGSLPYLLNSNQGQQGKPYRINFSEPNTLVFDFDLGEKFLIDRVHLHLLDLSYTIPAIHHPEYAFPLKYSFYGSDNADFSSMKLLKDHQNHRKKRYGNIKIDALIPEEIRYLRWEITKPYKYLSGKVNAFGLAEIQAFSKDRNVLQGVIAKSNSRRNYLAPRLTDNLNNFGEILNVYEWMHQLSRRHVLELALPRLEESIELKVDEQRMNLVILSGVVILSIIMIILVIIFNKLRQQKIIQSIKNRIAADLHDELGANLHSIILLTQLAESNKNQSDKTFVYLDKISALAKRTSLSTKHCTDVLEKSDINGNTLVDMEKLADKLIGDIDYQWECEANIPLDKLSERHRFDFFLFYKESLTNILRHSKATKVKTELTFQNGEIILIISDNGIGYLDSNGNIQTPSSILRRANLIKGSLVVSQENKKGCCIQLSVPIKPMNFFRKHLF